METRIAAAAMLLLCIFLIVLSYVLGVEVGQAAKLQLHPGYEGARRAPAIKR